MAGTVRSDSNGMDKKSLFWWYGHTPVETARNHPRNIVFMVEIMRKAGEKVKIGYNPPF
jgi:hypothetical protein